MRTVDTTASGSATRTPRDEQRRRTRQALIDASVELFATKGYDETTTDEVARAAGVSPRTFFRYFPTKESVLFVGEDHFIRAVTGVLLAAPPELDDYAALREAFVGLAPVITRIRTQVALYRQALATSAVLRGHERAAHEENIATVARAIAQRHSSAQPDERCDLLAHVALLLLELAVQEWLRRPARAELGPIISDRFDALRALTA